MLLSPKPGITFVINATVTLILKVKEVKIVLMSLSSRKKNINVPAVRAKQTVRYTLFGKCPGRDLVTVTYKLGEAVREILNWVTESSTNNSFDFSVISNNLWEL